MILTALAGEAVAACPRGIAAPNTVSGSVFHAPETPGGGGGLTPGPLDRVRNRGYIHGMEFPQPTIDTKAAAVALLQVLLPGSWPNDLVLERVSQHLAAHLAQAWEEGRWSPPGACANPYGDPAEPVGSNTKEEWSPGEPLRQLRLAARAALDWVENMAPTVRRTALANQLREALGGK